MRFLSSFHFTGIPCPIRFFTGISCPGCGLTRAWLAFLRGDISLALYYHPLFFLVPLVFFLLFLQRKKKSRIAGVLMLLMVAGFLLVYAYRMFFTAGDIVVFEPFHSLPFRILLAFHHH